MDGGWLSIINPPIAILILAMININQYPCFYYIGDNIVHTIARNNYPMLFGCVWRWSKPTRIFSWEKMFLHNQQILGYHPEHYPKSITMIHPKFRYHYYQTYHHIIWCVSCNLPPPVLSWFIIIIMNHHESPWYFSIIHQYIINHIPINPYCCCWLKHHFAEVTPYNLHKSHCFFNE